MRGIYTLWCGCLAYFSLPYAKLYQQDSSDSLLRVADQFLPMKLEFLTYETRVSHL